MFLFSIFYKNETALVLILLVIVTDIMLSDFEFNWSWHVKKLQKKMLLFDTSFFQCHTDLILKYILIKC